MTSQPHCPGILPPGNSRPGANPPGARPATLHWTEAEDATLTAMLRDRYSFTLISAAIPGRTRNSCISRAHRLGLNNFDPVHCKPVKYVPAQTLKPRAYRRIRVPREWPAVVAVPNGAGVPLMAIGPHQCRFISGVPAGPATLFCGAPTAETLPYCVYHARMAYAPNPKAKTPAPERVSA